MIRAFVTEWDDTVSLVFAESASKARSATWRSLNDVFCDCDGTWFAQIKVRRWPEMDKYQVFHRPGQCRRPCLAPQHDVIREPIESPFGLVIDEDYTDTRGLHDV